ncbi:hypothetical protein [Planotetraspora sp. GP83]|uniref:hypothetical protein n=1 Tax=Planotetraspora sp. GP83 TaxID=3156264 RepID=UPI0035194854
MTRDRPTTNANLGAACAHDHDLRDHGWRLIQPQPGHLTWISRTGHHYPVTPPPIIEPLPEPITPTIPQIPETTSENDLPLPSTWEYGPAWLEETQPQQPPGTQPTPADQKAADEEGAAEELRPPGKQPIDPGADIPPF